MATATTPGARHSAAAPGTGTFVGTPVQVEQAPVGLMIVLRPGLVAGGAVTAGVGSTGGGTPTPGPVWVGLMGVSPAQLVQLGTTMTVVAVV